MIQRASVSPFAGAGPLAHEPFRVARLPAAWVIGVDRDVHRRTWGVELESWEGSVAAEQALREAGDVATPAEASETQRWQDSTDAFALTLPGAGAWAWEVASVPIPGRSLAILEQLATYLRVTAPGVSYRTTADADPFQPQPFVSGGSSLTVVWRLVAPQGARPRALGVPAHTIPSDPPLASLPVEWTDFRFGWGGHYTTNMRVVVPSGPRVVRLFVIATLVGAAEWSIFAGGRLAGFTQLGGSRRAALHTALTAF